MTFSCFCVSTTATHLGVLLSHTTAIASLLSASLCALILSLHVDTHTFAFSRLYTGLSPLYRGTGYCTHTWHRLQHSLATCCFLSLALHLLLLRLLFDFALNILSLIHALPLLSLTLLPLSSTHTLNSHITVVHLPRALSLCLSTHCRAFLSRRISALLRMPPHSPLSLSLFSLDFTYLFAMSLSSHTFSSHWGCYFTAYTTFRAFASLPTLFTPPLSPSCHTPPHAAVVLLP